MRISQQSNLSGAGFLAETAYAALMSIHQRWDRIDTEMYYSLGRRGYVAGLLKSQAM